jgi:SAM-dependent methyltransferase
MSTTNKNELIAGALGAVSGITLDIGFAQNPNPLLSGEVHGIDIIRAPLPEGYSAVHVCDLNSTKLPFADGTVAAVTMGCTLAHVANPLKILAEINRVRAPGGLLVVSSPNPNYYWESVLNIFYHHFKSRVSSAKHEEHFFEFSRYNMRTIADRAGFKVTREIGCTFQLVKTPLRFNPLRMPGIAYEIIYVLQKVGAPKGYATFESKKGIERIPTDLFS